MKSVRETESRWQMKAGHSHGWLTISPQSTHSLAADAAFALLLAATAGTGGSSAPASQGMPTLPTDPSPPPPPLPSPGEEEEGGPCSCSRCCLRACCLRESRASSAWLKGRLSAASRWTMRACGQGCNEQERGLVRGGERVSELGRASDRRHERSFDLTLFPPHLHLCCPQARCLHRLWRSLEPHRPA